MILPPSTQLNTHVFGNVFQRTTASFKYFWMLSILQLHANTNELHISVWDIVIRMVANAWYPIHYFRLSFGCWDSLYQIVMELHIYLNIAIDADVDTIVDLIKEKNDDPQVKKQLKILARYVPYRFLNVWIDSQHEKDIIERSHSLENGCLYSLYRNMDEFYIEINPIWNLYLHSNYKVLVDFVYWNLTQFLQVRNPNVPAISNKLIKPYVRKSLSSQHAYWNKVLDVCGPIRCIYTNREIYNNDYVLDHFIPWSFVTHDLLWNLVPADRSINSSKNDKLPNLDQYLIKLSLLHHHSLQALIKAKINIKLMDDYMSLGYTIQELSSMTDEKFLEIYQKIFNPIVQIALNMGFETWRK